MCIQIPEDTLWGKVTGATAESTVTEVLKDIIMVDHNSAQMPNKFLSRKTGWTVEAINLIKETGGPVDQYLAYVLSCNMQP